MLPSASICQSFSQLRRAQKVGPPLGLLGFACARDVKVVVDAEDPRSPIGLDGGNGRIALVVDYPEEGNVAIFHDNVDGVEASRWIICDATSHQCDAAATGTHRLRDAALVSVIFSQAGLRIDAVVDGSADSIVVRRIGEDVDLVVYRVDGFNAFENVGCAAF